MPSKPIAGVRTGAPNIPNESEADTEEQVIDGWDGWSDSPVAPASDGWTEQPCISIVTTDASAIREAIKVGRACLNEFSNNKNIKAAVLMPLGMARSSNTELLLLFNKSSGALPLSLPTTIGDTSPQESIGWDSLDESETLSNLSIQEIIAPDKGTPLAPTIGLIGYVPSSELCGVIPITADCRKHNKEKKSQKEGDCLQYPHFPSSLLTRYPR